jgi:hypothetical protein
MLNNRNTPERYGELIAQKNDTEALKIQFSRQGMDAATGLLVLEVQMQIMKFLVGCCTSIMHEIPISELTSSKYNVLPLSPAIAFTGNGMASLAVVTAKTPYRTPARIDCSRLESLFHARASFACDHIATLREDPAYFAEQLFEVRDHLPFGLKDTQGQEHQLWQPKHRQILWSHVIPLVLIEAHTDLEIWSALESSIQKLQRKWPKERLLRNSENIEPDSFLYLLHTFLAQLKAAEDFLIKVIRRSLPPSPNMRTHCERTSASDNMSAEVSARMKYHAQLDATQADLLWLVRVLTERTTNFELAGFSSVVDEIGRVVDSESKARELLSPRIAAIVGDLAIFAEADRQAIAYLQWAEEMDPGMFGETANPCPPQELPTPILMVKRDEATCKQLARLCDPGKGRFDYPIDKSRTLENVTGMRSAERHLDAFWAFTDQSMRSCKPSDLPETALDRLLA